MSFRLLVLSMLTCLAFAVAGRPIHAQVPGLYENKAEGVAFVAPRGWTVTETASQECLFSVEAVKDRDCRLQICVSPPRPDLLLTRNAFVSCENIKIYIAQSLKGLNPVCQRGRAGNLQAFDTVYERRVQGVDGVRVQVVNHLFAPVRGRLVQVMAYTLGDTQDQARQRYLENRLAFERMIHGVRFSLHVSP